MANDVIVAGGVKMEAIAANVVEVVIFNETIATPIDSIRSVANWCQVRAAPEFIVPNCMEPPTVSTIVEHYVPGGIAKKAILDRDVIRALIKLNYAAAAVKR